MVGMVKDTAPLQSLDTPYRSILFLFSPDLNPTEMVWDDLDSGVKAQQPTSSQHLWELLRDC